MRKNLRNFEAVNHLCVRKMTSRVATRATSPAPDEVECMDMLHPLKNDNNLPLISTTPSMPPIIKTADRPVVLYMAPVHKLQHEDETPDLDIKSSMQNIQLN
ncbi:hypothetical protein ANCCEY_00052 [Ancylostoma ceylanicum]|uniref:Uncharacterized protein n=1 Tax=Ancylostoma ceylanicum TaxID=53326 RepID=A0A0D6M9S5_9BILA|nr:hypothetical protein ANCCEY_00052 [Ancylostoma ceylanicum]